MIYILVGKSCSGKTTAREYLKSRGYETFEASEFVRNAKKRGNEPSIQVLFDKLGKDFVAREIYRVANLERDVVILGFRTLEEINFIRKKGWFTRVIGITSSDELCSKRFKENREDSGIDCFEGFIQKLEWDYALGLRKIIDSEIDMWIDNNSEKYESLYSQLNSILGGQT